MNPPDSGANAVPHASAPRWRWKWWSVIGLLIALCVIIWILAAQSNRPSAIVLTDRSAFHNRVSAVLNSLPPGPRDSLRKLKFRLFGPGKLAVVDVLVVRFTNSPSLDNAVRLAVDKNPDNLQFWIVPVTNSAAFRSELKRVGGATVLSSQQMNVFSGHAAQMAQTANPIPGVFEGFTVDVLPQLRNDAIDLAIRLEALTPVGQPWNATVTNVLASARFNLPLQSGALVVPRADNGCGCSTGVFVLPTIFSPKK